MIERIRRRVNISTQWWQRWLPSLIATILVTILLWLNILEPLEHIAYQWLYQWRGHMAWDDRVVLVKIDDASLQKLGKFPWSRDRYTQLLNILETARPNTVIFDLIFAEPSPADQQLAQVMRRHQQVVLGTARLQADQIWQPNLPLSQAAIAQGHMLYQLDSDGIVRRLPTYVQQTPTLSLPSIQSYRLFAEAPRPPTAKPYLWLNWIGQQSNIPQYSFHQIVNGQIAPTVFRNKIILVGVTATGFNPLMTPFDKSPPASGVHMQVNLLNNLLNQNLLRPLYSPFWFSILLLSNLLWNGCLQRLTMRQHLWLGAGFSIGWICLSLLMLHQNYWLPITIPLMLWLSTTLLYWIGRNLQLEARNQRLNYLANIDELTQIANRRAFDQYLQQEWQRSLREQQPLSLLLCDVDFFKQFNDYYGHLNGDKCLYQVAQTLQDSTQRPTDLIARYGGEEFAIILPNTNLKGAQKISSHILSNVRSSLIPHQASDISHYITVSLGSVTTIPTTDMNWYDYIAAADQALYIAKDEGRDRACNQTFESPIDRTDSTN